MSTVRGRLLYDGFVACGQMTDDELSHLMRVAACLHDDEPMGLTNIEHHALHNRYPTLPAPRDQWGPLEGCVFDGHRVVIVPARGIAPKEAA